MRSIISTLILAWSSSALLQVQSQPTARAPCSASPKDTLCSPSSGTKIGKTFNAEFRAISGQSSATDYITFSYEGEGKSKASSRQFSTRAKGFTYVIEANGVKVPCGLRGDEYTILVSILIEI